MILRYREYCIVPSFLQICYLSAVFRRKAGIYTGALKLSTDVMTILNSHQPLF